jgi:uroporphyrin-III C-methyltransferase
MMGLSRIGIICKQLIEGGMNKKTPVAVIQEGTTPQQKMITGNVSNISKLVTQKKIRPPSIIIIGKVVNLSKIIGWK